MIRVCFVCLGNICRSPSAEGVMRHLLAEAGLSHAVEIDSAGTGAYHEGEPPDRRARAAARARGIEVDGRARQFVPADFGRFDYVVAMDAENVRDLARLAPDVEAAARISSLLAFDPGSAPDAPVPDPYHGGAEAFDNVLDLCLAGCRGLLSHLRREHGL